MFDPRGQTLTSDPVLNHCAAVFTVYTAKPGSEHLLLRELRQLARASRLENGCVLFDLFRVSGSEPAAFALYEMWRDPEARETHHQTFHARRFEANLPEYLERQESYVLEELQ